METVKQQANPANETNIAETLARVLPKSEVVFSVDPSAGGTVHYVAVPNGHRMDCVDTENLLSNPRHMKCTAQLDDVASFVDYVKRHATQSGRGSGAPTVWVEFNPTTFKLKFCAVLDEHQPGLPGWRSHRAEFEPASSIEWNTWSKKDRTNMSQVSFAEFLQENENDIASGAPGLPSSLEMHQLATNFVINEDRVLKSKVRLQSGGTQLTFVADSDAETENRMQLFERFSLGIPVFRGGTAWALLARLKYRTENHKVMFYYELIRADRVYEASAKELISMVTTALDGVPVLLGGCV